MPVRILHIVGDSKFGGASFGILRLASRWRSVGWQVEVLSTDPDLAREAERRSVPVVPLDVIWRDIRPWRDLQGLIALTSFLRQNRYDVVHTHTTKAGFVGRLAAMLAGVPVVVHTAHGFAFHERSPWWKIAFYVTLERLASAGCHRVVAVSEFHERWGTRLGIAPRGKILSIPNGIPEPPAPASPAGRLKLRESLGIRESDFLVLTPGRLAPEKGLEDLIDALARVKAAGTGFRCIIVGDGPIREALERQASARGLAGDILFTGFRSDVAALLDAADAVVLPSWREGLSIALLEAMAAGRAIVTTSIGSTCEATAEGSAALLFEPGAIGSMADLMVRLAADPPLRQRLGEAARRVYLERYTLDRMLDQYHSLYQHLLKENHGSQSISALLPTADR